VDIDKLDSTFANGNTYHYSLNDNTRAGDTTDDYE